MRTRGKVAKYLKKRTPSQAEEPQKTMKPQRPAEDVVESPTGPIQVDETLFQNSLTPINVLKKIHQDIVRTMGIRPGFNGKFTPLEQEIVQQLELIVRKGHCPSVLYKIPDLRAAFECLARFFERAQVTIDGQAGTQGRKTIPVFSSLIQYARKAAEYEKQLKDLRTKATREHDPQKKEEFKKILARLKSDKDHCLIMYQKIIFSDAEALQVKRKQRLVSLFGKPCTMDDLLTFFRKGGSIKNAETPLNQEVDDTGLGDPFREQPPSFDADPDFMPPTTPPGIEDTLTNLDFATVDEADSSITFEGASEEVLDWSQIKKKSRH